MVSSSSNTNATSTSSSSSGNSSGASSGSLMRQEFLTENTVRKARNVYSSANSTVITKTAKPAIQRLFIVTEQSDTSISDDVHANRSKRVTSSRSGSRANTFDRNKHASEDYYNDDPY